MKLRSAVVGATLIAALATTGCTVMNPLASISNNTASNGGGSEWDAGNIFSDAVFYDADYLKDEPGIQAALDKVGAQCTAASCLRDASFPMPGLTAQHCTPLPASPQPIRYARILLLLGKACGFNPAVAIAMIQKESQGLSKATPPNALTGFGCPDSGPGGSANCGHRHPGYGLRPPACSPPSPPCAKTTPGQPVHRRADPRDHVERRRDRLRSGPGSGAEPRHRDIYTYTPYQPNEASLAAYPGTGDRCSAYGNRNLFELFQRTFGSTGGGKAVPGAVSADGIQAVAHSGVNVQIPNNQFVDPAVRGKVVQAPTEGMAKGLAAGFGALGLPYVWGRSDAAGGGPDNGCGRGGGDLNSTCGSGRRSGI